MQRESSNMSSMRIVSLRKADETDLEMRPIEIVGPGSYIHRPSDLAGTSLGHTCRRSY